MLFFKKNLPFTRNLISDLLSRIGQTSNFKMSNQAPNEPTRKSFNVTPEIRRRASMGEYELMYDEKRSSLMHILDNEFKKSPTYLKKNPDSQSEIAVDVSKLEIVLPEKETEMTKNQVKAFVRWCNAKLKVENYPMMYDLEKEIVDAYKVAAILDSALGIKSNLPPKKKIDEKIRKIQELDAMNTLFANFKGKINIGTIKPEDVCSGELKLKLGFIWSIILETMKLKLVDSDSGNLGQAIQKWINSILSNDEYGGLTLKNYPSDLKDGMILSAVLSHYKAISWESVKKMFDENKETDEQRINRVITEAKSQFGIDALVDVSDFIEKKLDPKIITTYLSEWLYKFSLKERQKDSIEIIDNFVTTQMSIDILLQTYTRKAEKLVSNFIEWENKFNIEKLGSSTLETRELLRDYEQYYSINRQASFLEMVSLSVLDLEIRNICLHNSRKDIEIKDSIKLNKIKKMNEDLIEKERNYFQALENQFSELLKNENSKKMNDSQYQEKIAKIWKNFDVNNYGVIDMANFYHAVQALGIIPSKKDWDLVSKDNETIGEAAFTEFCLSRIKLSNSKEGLFKAFENCSIPSDKTRIQSSFLYDNFSQAKADFMRQKFEDDNECLRYFNYIDKVFK